jgi:L-ribulose-5-phosphate 4-epimerase
LDPLHVPVALVVAGHAPFCWGETPSQAAHKAVVLEEIATLAFITLATNPKLQGISKHLCDKHFFRKHGAGAYYGQENSKS